MNDEHTDDEAVALCAPVEDGAYAWLVYRFPEQVRLTCEKAIRMAKGDPSAIQALFEGLDVGMEAPTWVAVERQARRALSHSVYGATPSIASISGPAWLR